ncbi:hypothetical protein [Azospirillum sp. B4]|uniref:hypothetical protein n=1 Tax=Azospirillum sp. B4 TaxID=95605 RepID=UPI0011DE00EE|nr:hypothetical protein [Azospirillum sp. B4]
MRFIFRWVLIPMFLCATPGYARNYPHALGLYSNIHKAEEGGDFEGFEIWFVWSSDGDMIVFQDTAEIPSPPIVIPAKYDGSRLEFEVPEGEDGAGIYSGIVDGKYFTGKFKHKRPDGSYVEEPSS